MSATTKIWLETGEIVTLENPFPPMSEDFERNDARDQAKTDEFFKILAKEHPKEFVRVLGFFREQYRNYLSPPWVNPGRPVKRK